MNLFRIIINMLFSGLLIAAGLYLFSVDSYVLRGMLFIGLSKYLLSVALLLLASFAGIIAWGWISGGISMPPTSSFWFDPTYVHPTVKGELLVRYWYIMVPGLICFGLALAFAGEAPNKTKQHQSLYSPGSFVVDRFVHG